MHATPKTWFSNDWIVTLDDAQQVLLDLSVWRERATFVVNGTSYTLRKGVPFSGQFTLLRDQEVLASAHKTSVLSNRFEIQIGSDSFVLRKPSILQRRFELTRDEALIGAIVPDRILFRRCSLTLPPEWPSPIGIFVFWLAVVIWNREQSAAN